MNKTIAVATIIITLFSCSQKKQGGWKNIFPVENWLISNPIDQGIDPIKMQAALDYLESNSRQNGNKELIIIRNGYMIFGGDQIDSTHNIWSCSKTFTSTVLGLLVDDGILY